jgi:hypothetical protein
LITIIRTLLLRIYFGESELKLECYFSYKIHEKHNKL